MNKNKDVKRKPSETLEHINTKPINSSQFKIALKEFTDSLEGAKQLTAVGMRLEYRGQKMTKKQWETEFYKFANREVK